MNLKPLLITLALASICGPVLAQWQWTDKDGRKVYSDRAPPPEILEKNILKRPANLAKAVAQTAADAASAPTSESTLATAAPVASASAPKSTALDKEIEAKKKLAADAEATKLKADQERLAKAKVENCARAKQAKASFESGVRLARTNVAGEREVMDDAARAAELKRIQSVMDSDCK